MSCERKHLLEKLIVEDAAALKDGPWRGHVRECPECGLVWDGYHRSLAVFRQLERERVSRYQLTSSWTEFSQHLRRQNPWRRVAALARRPAFSGAAGFLLVGGLFSWFLLTAPANEPPPTADRDNVIQRPVASRPFTPVTRVAAGLAREYRDEEIKPTFRLTRQDFLEPPPEMEGVLAVSASDDFRASAAPERPATLRALESSWQPPISTPIRRAYRVEYPVYTPAP